MHIGYTGLEYIVIFTERFISCDIRSVCGGMVLFCYILNQNTLTLILIHDTTVQTIRRLTIRYTYRVAGVLRFTGIPLKP